MLIPFFFFLQNTLAKKDLPGSLHGPNWSIFFYWSLDKRKTSIYSLVWVESDIQFQRYNLFRTLLAICPPPHLLRVKTPLKFAWNFHETLLNLLWNTLEPSLKHSWNFLKHPLNFLETPLKLSVNTLQSAFQHSWNTTETL